MVLPSLPVVSGPADTSGGQACGLVLDLLCPCAGDPGQLGIVGNWGETLMIKAAESVLGQGGTIKGHLGGQAN